MPAAKGRGKARSSVRKNQQESEGKKGRQRPLRGRRTNILHRVQSHKPSNVDDVLYRFLGDLAAVSNNKRQWDMKNSRTKRSERPINKTRKTRAMRKLSTYSFQTSESPSKSIFDSTEDNESATTAMESATTRTGSSYSNTSADFSEPPVDSKKGLKDILRRKSLIDIMKNYIKVGIEAEEQRAKTYMKKAIMYGLNSGFLRPVEDSGHLLEISSDLSGIKVNVKRDVGEERKRRKNMRRGVVNFDDYEIKSVRKRNSSKLDQEKREKTGKTGPKRRTRSTTRNAKSTLKANEKKKEQNQLPKKKAKVPSQPNSRNTRSSRTRRSPTPWRSSIRSPSGDQNDESVHNDDKNNNSDHEDNIDTKEHDIESNNVKEKLEKRKMVSTSLRKEDGKNYIQDTNMCGNIEENFNLGKEIQEAVGSALQQGDKQ